MYIPHITAKIGEFCRKKRTNTILIIQYQFELSFHQRTGNIHANSR